MISTLPSPLGLTHVTNDPMSIKKENEVSWAVVPFHPGFSVAKAIINCKARQHQKQLRCILPSESSRSKRNVSMYVTLLK